MSGDGGTELGDFLRARRAAVPPPPELPGRAGRPGRPGRPGRSGRRRVRGLRREEVAAASGVSVDYYVRLEQGRDRHPSAQVLEALAGPLALDGAALRYLKRLAEPTAATGPGGAGRRPTSTAVRPGLSDLLRRLTDTPALVVNRRRDVLAADALATALCPAYTPGANISRFVFCDPRAPTVYLDWDEVAAQCVGSLRSARAEDPDDPELAALLDELSGASAAFAGLWAQPIVREKTDGLWRFHRAELGAITLAYESLSSSADHGQTLVAYRAAPGGDDERALVLLGALAATESDASGTGPSELTRAPATGTPKPNPPRDG